MADDIEVLRLRARAKAKAARERAGASPDGQTTQQPASPSQTMLQNLGAPWEQVKLGASQMGRNPLAGVGNIALGAVGAVATPLTAATTLVKEVPVLGDVVRGVEAVPEYIGKEVFRKGMAPLVPPWVGEREREEFLDVTEQAGGLLTGAALTGAIAKGGVKRYKTSPARKQAKGVVNFNREFPARMTEDTRPQDLNRMIPYLGESQRRSPVVPGRATKGDLSSPSVARQLAQGKFPEIKQRIFNETDAIIQRNAEAPLVGGAERIATEVEGLRNIYTKNVDLKADASILEEAGKYREMGAINVRQASDLLHKLNAGLQKFYNMTDEAQAATENLGKPIAEMERAAASIRDAISKTLEQRGEDAGWYRERMLDYGAAARLEGAAARNVVRAEQPLPPWLTRTSMATYPNRTGVRIAALENTLGRWNTPDKTAARAMKAFAATGRKPPPPPMFAPPRVAGLLPERTQTRGPFNLPAGEPPAFADQMRVTTGNVLPDGTILRGRSERPAVPYPQGGTPFYGNEIPYPRVTWLDEWRNVDVDAFGRNLPKRRPR